jgi:hypothetical protein
MTAKYDPASHLESECRIGGCVGCETAEYRAMKAKDYDPAWMLSVPVEWEKIRDAVRVTDLSDPVRSCVLSFTQLDGEDDLCFNGVRIEVHDDFMAYISLLDEIMDDPATRGRSYPYSTDDEF